MKRSKKKRPEKLTSRITTSIIESKLRIRWELAFPLCQSDPDGLVDEFIDYDETDWMRLESLHRSITQSVYKSLADFEYGMFCVERIFQQGRSYWLKSVQQRRVREGVHDTTRAPCDVAGDGPD